MAATQSMFSSWSAWWAHVSLTLRREDAQESSWADQYDYLKSYYLNNGVYEDLRARYTKIGYSNEQLKALRNPAFRVVEFYAAKLWPGNLPAALPIVPERQNGDLLIAAIAQLHTASNWASEKQAVARSFPMLGDLFLKVATRTDETGQATRVYIQTVEPASVTDFDSDERGYVTFCRIDVPITERQADGKLKAFTHTEVWDKPNGIFSRWRHEKGAKVALGDLGDPLEVTELARYGIDFVPIVWEPFRNIGDSRGMAAITPAMEKIDEANRMATRLHKILYRYNQPLWVATAGGNDASNRPLPPPRLGGAEGNKLERTDDPDVEDVIRLPGSAGFTSLIPAIDYGSALTILQDQMAEIRQDLPEMVYSQIQERSDLSGVAIRYLMEAATDRLLEARGSAEAALSRAHEMALTIGIKAGLFPSSLGRYETGDFRHSFLPRPVFTLAELERAQVFAAYTGGGMPIVTATKRIQWSDAEREDLIADQERESHAANAGIAAALLNAQDAANAGVGGGSFTDEETDNDPE